MNYRTHPSNERWNYKDPRPEPPTDLRQRLKHHWQKFMRAQRLPKMAMLLARIIEGIGDATIEKRIEALIDDCGIDPIKWKQNSNKARHNFTIARVLWVLSSFGFIHSWQYQLGFNHWYDGRHPPHTDDLLADLKKWRRLSAVRIVTFHPSAHPHNRIQENKITERIRKNTKRRHPPRSHPIFYETPQHTNHSNGSQNTGEQPTLHLSA